MLQLGQLLLFFFLPAFTLKLQAQDAANLVKQQFIYGYNAYQKYAWGCDELYPVSKSCRNYHEFSLMWTPIAAIDTLYLMNLTDLLDDTIQLICHSNFTFDHDQFTSTFDLYIRTLGGLISGYYLTEYECLKELAIDVGERIYKVFETSTLSGLPYKNVNMQTGKVDKTDTTTDVASIATNMIEYGALSYLANNMKYYYKAKDIMSIVHSQRSQKYGLVGNCINIESDIHGNNFWCGDESFIDAGIDSYYEYQIKCWKLFEDEDCLNIWMDSNYSIINYLSYYENQIIDGKNKTVLWFKRVNKDNISEIYDDSMDYDLYAAFFSSLLTLSDNLKLAEMNQDSNWFMWNLTSVEPSDFNFEYNEEVNSNYDLNPENFESNYYLYMVTNNSIYYDRAVQYLNDLMNHCKCDDEECVGYSGVIQSTTSATFQHTDSSPSFFYAETLKYLYLTFLRNEENNPLKFEDVIFTTSAHPIPKKWGKHLQHMKHTNSCSKYNITN